jgi:hypothetical protein
MPWREVLATAHASELTQTRRLAKKTVVQQVGLPLEHIVFCLKLVALRLAADTITQQQYHDEREAILTEDASRRSSGVDLRLPTEHQIMEVFVRRKKGGSVAGLSKETPEKTPPLTSTRRTGAWNAALRAAGLQPTPSGKVTVPRGLTSAELIECCYQVHGVLPSSNEAEIFAHANRIPYNRKRQHHPWRQQVAEWRAGRLKRGLPAPDALPRRSDRPDYSREVGAGLPSRHRNNWSDLSVCLTHVSAYMTQLKRNERATVASYDQWATRRGNTPHMSELRKHGTWTEMRKMAQARTRK